MIAHSVPKTGGLFPPGCTSPASKKRSGTAASAHIPVLVYTLIVPGLANGRQRCTRCTYPPGFDGPCPHARQTCRYAQVGPLAKLARILVNIYGTAQYRLSRRTQL